MKFLYILKTGTTFPSIREKFGDFGLWTIESLNPKNIPVKVVNAESDCELPSPENCLGVVITGSHAMVTEDLPWSLNIEKWMPALVLQEIPVLAICYGHQLLARAMGGEVGYHPRGIETGTIEIRLHQQSSEDPLFGSLPNQFSAQADHSQSVSKLPPGAVCLAYSSHEANHAFRIGRCAWGLQFHPEFSAEIMKLYILEQENKLQNAGLDIQQLLHGITDTPVSLEITKRFIEIVK